MSLISKMDVDTYEAVKRVFCPYCRAGLPEALHGGNLNSYWEHAIPGTAHRFKCLANPVRLARHDPADVEVADHV